MRYEMVAELFGRNVGEAVDPGTRVEVRSRFDQSWTRGFEIAERTEAGYRIRRISDGMVLPAEFGDDDVRQEKRHRNLWWY
jgi:hypothetical protein